MATTLDFDAEATKQVEAIYSTPDVANTRAAVMRAAAAKPGETALDVGCGPGYLLRDLALAVGGTGQAIGTDISEPMLNLARKRCAGLAQVTIENADACKLPLADSAADLACGLQIYAYVPALDEALAELRRVLKPGGRAIILDTDFDSLVWQSRDRARMQRIRAAYDKHVAWPDLPRILPKRLKAAGFRVARCEIAPMLTLDFNSNTYAWGISRFMHRFVTANGVAKAEADAWLAECDALQREGAFFFSLNRYVFSAVAV